MMSPCRSLIISRRRAITIYNNINNNKTHTHNSFALAVSVVQPYIHTFRCQYNPREWCLADRRARIVRIINIHTYTCIYIYIIYMYSFERGVKYSSGK